ncbi:hypothetical protein, partial [Zooshikella sp. RANM57]|uniref:hypothetical protein n=1 Tax=Zooshikella sp. RANM57 TaxID=3425863 RepID=UPI003D6EE14B
PIAIFDGHTHHFDYSNLINDPTWGTVPVFTTEAAFYGGYHIVTYDEGKLTVVEKDKNGAVLNTWNVPAQ